MIRELRLRLDRCLRPDWYLAESDDEELEEEDENDDEELLLVILHVVTFTFSLDEELEELELEELELEKLRLLEPGPTL
ncbi:unnamed protein product [Taenia asiatica]|uniref:Uncharacterized protein n=1 Tax=Taenia asiatica TaxID=60517 RepID=A0A0R3W7H4_TAEAS|nr:unnamed protein product [Taenia asiatica]